MSTNKPPRKHHFVQAEHLRQFVGKDDLLHVYSLDGKQFLEKPAGIFKKKDLNSFEGPNGLDTSFEGLVTDVENACWPIINGILERETVEDSDLDGLATYIALSRVRNPTMQAAIIEQHRQIVVSTASIMDRVGHFDELGPNPIDRSKTLSELISSGLVQIDINNSVYLDALRHMMEPFIEVLVGGFRWGLVKSSHERVLISDHPVTFLHPGREYGAYGIPPGGTGCEVAFPLSKSVYLLGLWKTDVGVHSSEGAIDELNMRQSIFANQHIAASHHRSGWRRLANRFSGFGYYTDCSCMPSGDGSFHFMRSGVFKLNYDRSYVGKHPTTKTRPISKWLDL